MEDWYRMKRLLTVHGVRFLQWRDMTSFVNRHRFDALLDPTFHFMPIKIRSRSDPIPKFYKCWKIRFLFTFIYSSASQNNFIIRVGITGIIISFRSVLKFFVLKFLGKKQCSGSGSFHHQAKIVRNTLISSLLWFLYDFFIFKEWFKCSFKK